MLNSSARVRPWRRPPPAARALAAVIATSSLALLTAACGNSKSPAVAHVGTGTTQSSTTSAGSSSERSTYDQAVTYAKCIRMHGVPLWPNPERGGVFDKSKLTPRQLGVSTLRSGTAERACKNLLPRYSSAQQSHVLTQALRFSQCMRAHGATSFPTQKATAQS